MSYKVITPLVGVAPKSEQKDLEDANQGPRYFYEGAVIPDGFNDERCKELVEEKMLEVVKAAEPSGDGAGSGTVDEVLAEVGDDPEKAKAAIESEKAGKNRSTLLSKLEGIANPA